MCVRVCVCVLVGGAQSYDPDLSEKYLILCLKLQFGSGLLLIGPRALSVRCAEICLHTEHKQQLSAEVFLNPSQSANL